MVKQKYYLQRGEEIDKIMTWRSRRGIYHDNVEEGSNRDHGAGCRMRYYTLGQGDEYANEDMMTPRKTVTRR